LSRAPDIILQLEKILYKIENKILVKVTSAEKLSSSEKSELEQFLKKRYEVKEILFKEIVDSRVIGGMKIEIDEEVLDSTIKNRIQKLQEHLIS
jgi:F-type H+-transporting ATPase subunit delta